jgi:SAM-dependent methyltransferase
VETVMIGPLYDRALAGERCWLRTADDCAALAVERWLGNDDHPCDAALAARCEGPTLDLACGPGRFLTLLRDRGIEALGVDQSARAVELARLRGVRAVRGDLFGPLPGEGTWQTVLLADVNIGIGGDPLRLLDRCRGLLRQGGHCLVEFDPAAAGCEVVEVRLELDGHLGPWFPWATVGLDAIEELGSRVSLRLKDVEVFGDRGVAELAAI